MSKTPEEIRENMEKAGDEALAKFEQQNSASNTAMMYSCISSVSYAGSSIIRAMLQIEKRLNNRIDALSQGQDGSPHG